MASPGILVERDGPVATVTLNRPRVLTGAGRAFCAGDDLRELPTQSADEFRAHVDEVLDREVAALMTAHGSGELRPFGR